MTITRSRYPPRTIITPFSVAAPNSPSLSPRLCRGVFSLRRWTNVGKSANRTPPGRAGG